MARVKSPAARKHRRLLRATKGFRDSRGKRLKTAREGFIHAGQYAYEGRKLKKRDLKSLWILRINAAVRENGLTYSRFMASLKKAKIEINRKMLAEIAAKDPNAFKEIVAKLK